MSNNHIKNPGSFADIPGTTNQPGARKSGGEPTHQSGWQNYPENIDELLQEELEKQSIAAGDSDATEEILKQLIEENTKSLLNDQQSEEPLIPVVTENTLPENLPIPEPVLTNHKHIPENLDEYAGQHQQVAGDDHYLEHQLEELSKRSLTASTPTPPPPLPEIMPQGDEQLQVEALERWLDKPMPEKENAPHWAVLGYTLACLGVTFLIYTAVFITGNYKNFNGPLVQLGSLVTGGTTPQNSFGDKETGSPAMTTAGSSSHSKSTAGSGQTGQITGSLNGSGKGSGSDGSGSSSSSNKAKAVSAAAVIASPGLKEVATADCPVPQINISAAPGGFSDISMQSECHKEKAVTLKYAGISVIEKFDDTGALKYRLDAFAGADEPVTFEFYNGKQISKNPVLEGMEYISKVAVIWSNRENVDLHAFEYAARSNTTGHVWEQNPRNFDNALQKVKALNSGRGFISTINGLSRDNKKRVEVYTFLHNQEQESGVVKLALTYDNGASLIRTVSCESSKQDSFLSYQTVQLLKNSPAIKEEGQILIDNCQTDSPQRYISQAVKDLILN